ncbi:hypothetical protein [Lacinutrix undariae]
MKHINIIILFCLITISVQSQCESLSKEIWNIIKIEEYERFDSLIMSIEQQRKILHWTKSEETDKILLKIKGSLKTELISSAKKLRLEISEKGFDLKETVFKRCEINEDNELKIIVCYNEKEYNFEIVTLKTDKFYITLPINSNAIKLPKFKPTKEELANSSIIIAGEKFKSIVATEKEKKKGMKILKNCIKNKDTLTRNIVFVDGMKDKNNMILLTYMSIAKSDIKRYRVNLDKEICETE